MITKWKVENFKSFCKESELELGPLTIFTGPNSGGKSSFIQSILIVAQTMVSKGDSDSVALEGIYANFGEFNELKSSGGKENEITITSTCSPEPHFIESDSESEKTHQHNKSHEELSSISEISWKMSFESKPNNQSLDVPSAAPKLNSSGVSCTEVIDDEHKQNYYISAKRINEATESDRGSRSKSDSIRNGSNFSVELDEYSHRFIMRNSRVEKIRGCKLNHLLPKFVTIEINTLHENSENIFDILLNPSNYNGFVSKDILNYNFPMEIVDILREIFKSVELDIDSMTIGSKSSRTTDPYAPSSFSIQNWQELTNKLDSEQLQKITTKLSKLDNLQKMIYNSLINSENDQKKNSKIVETFPGFSLTESIEYLEDYFRYSVKYLGPLRDSPRPIYQHPLETNTKNVGIRGEFTAAVIDSWKNLDIEYIRADDYENNVAKKEVVSGSLENAVIEWLRYLDVADSVDANKKEYGHELKVSVNDSNEKRHLTQVGVGVSQILPILVLGLISEPDSTIIFEQPELQLHPKVQSLLGDFFHSLTLVNKQCIVETHSEYLVDQIRFRIADTVSEIDPVMKTKIFFVKYKPEDNMSEYEEIIYNEYGKIFNWPEGFFNQSPKLSTKIVNSAMKKNRL